MDIILANGYEMDIIGYKWIFRGSKNAQIQAHRYYARDAQGYQ